MSWLEILRWAGVATLGALSLLAIIGNPLAAWSAVRRGKGYSWVPFIGGLAGVVAILLAPVGTVRQRLFVAWIPLMLDLTFTMFFYSFLFLVPREAVRSRAAASSKNPTPDGTEDEGAAL